MSSNPFRDRAGRRSAIVDRKQLIWIEVRDK